MKRKSLSTQLTNQKGTKSKQTFPMLNGKNVQLNGKVNRDDGMTLHVY